MAGTQGEERRESKGSGPESGSSNGRSGRQAMQTQGSRELMRGRGARDLGFSAWEPFAMMNQLSRDMDRVWESFFGRSRFGGRDDERQLPTMWAPQIDVERRDDRLVVRADLPGVRREDIDIDINEDALTITGERRYEREAGEQDESYRFVERSYGRFYRSVPLPAGVNPDEISATMRDGVLEVSVPLPQNARRRRINIQG